MYLPPDQWSSRFDSTFFSVRIESARKCDSRPNLKEGIGGRTHTPAVYYELVVSCEHKKIVLLRRYSNFRWLYEQVKDFQPPHMEGDFTVYEPLGMPPGTCFLQPQDDAFILNRKGELAFFVGDLLSRPGYAEHPAVVLFFELDSFSDDSAS